MRKCNYIEKLAKYVEGNRIPSDHKYVNLRTGESRADLPKGAKTYTIDEAIADQGAIGSSDSEARSYQSDLKFKLGLLKSLPYVSGGMGGLGAYALASSLMDEPDEDSSLWEKVLAKVIPLGAAAAGAYGGYMLGGRIKQADAVSDEDAWVTTEDLWRAREEAKALDSKKDNERLLRWGPWAVGGGFAIPAAKNWYDYFFNGGIPEGAKFYGKATKDLDRRIAAAREAYEAARNNRISLENAQASERSPNAGDVERAEQAKLDEEYRQEVESYNNSKKTIDKDYKNQMAAYKGRQNSYQAELKDWEQRYNNTPVQGRAGFAKAYPRPKPPVAPVRAPYPSLPVQRFYKPSAPVDYGSAIGSTKQLEATREAELKDLEGNGRRHVRNKALMNTGLSLAGIFGGSWLDHLADENETELNEKLRLLGPLAGDRVE